MWAGVSWKFLNVLIWAGAFWPSCSQADLCLIHSPLARLPLAALAGVLAAFQYYSCIEWGGGCLAHWSPSFCFSRKMSTSLFWFSSATNRGVWQSRCPLPSLASKQGSLWKVLSVHCGFTATVSTSAILVHLPNWPLRGGDKININIVFNTAGL